ncbi:MAG TPA: signal peptidase I [Candidatus Ornithomonoglobus intestinigallinarum]|jgi:signal peptidase I|uniref:Signal peptidase I n=1 Tax=Candidatus Ornithomonoglobus intestinigallinarum TaxID=2840894 RepID=A0A9D1H334_9FIRM|nr:signal peptidase I [Candidatus Ornithomonoglobus intestinigallinarum]
MEEKSKKTSIGREIWEWFYTIAIALIIAMLIKTFLFDVVKVDGSSMYPTLVNNDRLIVTKPGYEPKQGDIIILDSTYKEREKYFDTLAAEEGKEELSAFSKFTKGFTLPDSLKKRFYVKRVIALPGQTVDLRDGAVYIDGELYEEPYYDGPTTSIDASVEYPITVEEDTVFVMGDNRTRSKDSRSSELGLVPYDAVLGKAKLRIWPLNVIGFVE